MCRRAGSEEAGRAQGPGREVVLREEEECYREACKLARE